MSDWRDIDDEEGEEVPSSRFGRMFRLGSMGAKVGASSVASKLGSMLPFGSKEKRAERLVEAMEENAEHVAEVLGQLKGASMKVGQLLSADPELLPDGFSEVISSLQKDAPPMTYETVKRQIEQSLDRDLHAVFDYFDDEPLGAASIGQVHRGRLSTGEEVAVKVQYPGVIDALESDLKTLERLLVYGRVVVDRDRLQEYLEEVREIVLIEADYETEADNMRRFREILSDREGMRAPKPYPRWTTQRVLVMEYVEGEKLDEELRRRDGPTRQALLERWVETYSWLFHEVHTLHADPHPGNFLLEADDTMVMLDFGAIKDFDASFTDRMLEVLVACWTNDDERAVELYKQLGFSADSAQLDDLDPELLRGYHEIVLAPFLADGAFDFGSWSPTMRSKQYMLSHPSFLKVVPPKDALLYMRVLSGIKGLLRKMEAEIDVRSMAKQTARRRGLWEG
jgi:predicted unusual protein kinase regulating ubiquinone biosynthesis (AarF/ABC1/UbiB family)